LINSRKTKSKKYAKNTFGVNLAGDFSGYANNALAGAQTPALAVAYC